MLPSQIATHENKTKLKENSLKINVGGYLEYREGCSVPWGDIMSTVGGYLEYRGGCSVPWGYIMMHVGGYHEYRGGCSVPWGEKSFVI